MRINLKKKMLRKFNQPFYKLTRNESFLKALYLYNWFDN